MSDIYPTKDKMCLLIRLGIMPMFMQILFMQYILHWTL